MSDDDGQMDVFDALPPHDVPHARRVDPHTSQLAADAIEQKEGVTLTFRPNTSKHVALSVIALAPRTAREVERVTHRDGIWKRVSDLKNAELIDEHGTRMDTRTRKLGIVWRINARGIRALARLDRGETVRL